ncbi:hypothetical protein [Paenarthrobacter nitroguajacolicus]|uniref:hypothetical protein n=1 Tax=Paenarthrobacter nitroguajacolicus TaxID=211146 RepID=UPI0015B9724D|nr:hypothetical protein [Paenarthrobacter nitroguajacolicus]NWL34444.1 hypothetical protein [Paenarthrobacter nitroguajacolicus]
MELHKNTIAIWISAEMLYMEKSLTDPRYDRKATRHETPPTAEDWALYSQALAGLRALEAYEGTEWGGPDYGTEVNEPQPRVTYEYHETHEEWLARCHKLDRSEA